MLSFGPPLTNSPLDHRCLHREPRTPTSNNKRFILILGTSFLRQRHQCWLGLPTSKRSDKCDDRRRTGASEAIEKGFRVPAQRPWLTASLWYLKRRDSCVKILTQPEFWVTVHQEVEATRPLPLGRESHGGQVRHERSNHQPGRLLEEGPRRGQVSLNVRQGHQGLRLLNTYRHQVRATSRQAVLETGGPNKFIGMVSKETSTGAALMQCRC